MQNLVAFLLVEEPLPRPQDFLKSEALTSTLGSSRETCQISAESLLSSWTTREYKLPSTHTKQYPQTERREWYYDANIN